MVCAQLSGARQLQPPVRAAALQEVHGKIHTETGGHLLQDSEAGPALWPSVFDFLFSTKSEAQSPISWEQSCYLLISLHSVFHINLCLSFAGTELSFSLVK